MTTYNEPSGAGFAGPCRCIAGVVPRASMLAVALAHPGPGFVRTVPGIVRLVEELIRLHPFFPPCPGGHIGARAAGWRCVNGRVVFVDTVAWRCPDGASVIKEGVTIVTDQSC